jgi:hypothetical protein
MPEHIELSDWIIKALSSIEKCYFDVRNERTFQCELYHQLKNFQSSTMKDYRLMSELEKVKKILGKRKRPDMIFHVPTQPKNEFVIELKRNVSLKKIEKDLETLKCLRESPLQYRHGFLISIGRLNKDVIEFLEENYENWMDEYLHVIETYLENDSVKISHFWFQQGKIYTTAQ